MNFGKNRVQYDDFFWTYYRYEKFDVYFYLGGKQFANYTANYTLKHLKEIETKLDFEIEDKMQFIIFNKLSDFKQSNIGYVNDESYNTGGLTHIMGNKVFLYFNGNYSDFQQQIRAGITEVVFNQLMFGSSLTAQIKNKTIFTIPDWYSKGLIAYISSNWNTEVDNIVRDGVLTGKYKKFNSLTGEDAIYAGQSFWKFIAEKYGEQNISNIIYMSRVSRNIETGFLYVLGVSYKEIVNEWIAYYQEKYSQSFQRNLPSCEPIIKKIKSSRVYNRLKISNDGIHSAYVSNEMGQYKVWIYNTETQKRKKIMKSGYKLDDKTDYSYPLLAWHPSGEILSIIVETKGLIYLYLYNLEEKKFEKILLQYFQKVLDFSYSQNGQLLVLSAVQNGQSDIFVYNMASHSSEQITKDIYDDATPRFINNSKEIIFCSNRISDTLNSNVSLNSNLMENKDIFLYDYAQHKKILRRVTKTSNANEVFPMEYENGYISYLSDENGIYNRYVARFDSVISYIDTTTHYRYITKSFPITDYKQNIIEQDISPRAKKTAEIIYTDGVYKMFLEDNSAFRNLSSKKISNTYYINRLLAEKENFKKDTLKKENDKVLSIKKKLRNVYYSDIEKDEQDTDNISVNYYKQAFLEINSKDSNNIQDDKLLFSQETQRNYEVEYTANEITTQLDFSFLNANYQQFSGGGSPIYLNPGFNFLMKIGLSDLMEDYRITGGFRFSFNFDNFEYLLSYENLKHRLDKQIIFHRQSIDNNSYYYKSHQYTHSVYYILRWPFNNVMSLRGTAYLRNDKEVFLSTDQQMLEQRDINNNWSGLKGEFVFDNTRNIGLNLYYGTRYKLWGEYYQSIDSKNRNLFVIGFDFRNYQKIHKSFIWANRFATSTSFGKNKLIYYMGGVDNWLFPKFNRDIDIATDQNYTYQTLATNMRGFTQNIRNGNSFAVLNSELRFPVFRYFSNKPMRSDFLYNLQIIGFGDLGTAWTGASPWDKNNSFFTKTLYGNPFVVTLEKEIDPLVGGVGFGVRSRLLGYFMRADYAWGIENGIVKSGIFYFSLSLDF
ncbi:MAG: hypothetical protein HXX18_10450 [Bacteroidetes bacterium]|nr:hypothetical protein [Bacteroidota bacterium]